MRNKKRNLPLFPKSELKILTGYGFDVWKKITGLFGPNIPTGIVTEDEIYCVGEKSVVCFYCNNSKIRFTISVYWKDGVINNDDVFIKKDLRGFGAFAHKNQVEFALNMGFHLMLLTAFGGINNKSKSHNGHVTWAKLGYTMTVDSHNAFIEEMQQKEISANCLQKLIYKNENYWEENGTEWDGEFDLTPNSINHKLLNRYLSKR